MTLLKKLGTMICVLMLCTACSTSNTASPTSVTATFLDAYLAHDNTLIQSNSEWKTFDASKLELSEQDYLPGVEEQLQKEVYQKMLDFTHEETSETIDEDRATVLVTLTVYDFAPTITKGLEEATKKTDELSQQSTISDEQIQAEILTLLFTNMNKAEQSKTIEVRVDLIKKKGVWLLADDNDDLKQALLQNTKAVENLA